MQESFPVCARRAGSGLFGVIACYLDGVECKDDVV